MEPITVILMSLTFIISSIAIITLGTKIKNLILNNRSMESGIASASDVNVVNNGHIYAVDVGDSMVVVIVVDKRNIFTGFLNTYSTPSELYDIKEAK